MKRILQNRTPVARKLRNTLTEAEKQVWYYLRSNNLGCKFRRQQPIGKYIVDFVCLSKKLVIEIDGGQHSENKTQDEERDKWLRQEGFAVLRFWNNEVQENKSVVIEKIFEYLL